jgi:D-glycero-D-manno-heptose 1,7-bisphosphate phosphatase
MRPTVFLDRDGVLNQKMPEDDYVKRVEELRLLPGVPEAVRRLSDSGMRLIITTNQRGIARGRFTEADLHGIHERMLSALAPARIDAIYFCPHDAEQCDCRKPAVGLFRRARAEHPEIDLTASLVVGDSLADLQAAEAIGSRAILIARGARREELLQAASLRGLPVIAAAPSLLAAVPLILQPGDRR